MGIEEGAGGGGWRDGGEGRGCMQGKGWMNGNAWLGLGGGEGQEVG